MIGIFQAWQEILLANKTKMANAASSWKSKQISLETL